MKKSQIQVINVNERPVEKQKGTESWSEIQKKEQRRIREKKRRMRKRARRLQMIRLVMSTGLMVLALIAGAHFFKKANSTGSANAGASGSTQSSENTENGQQTKDELTPVTLKYEVGTP